MSKEPSKSILRAPGSTNGQKKTLIFASPTKDNSPKVRKENFSKYTCTWHLCTKKSERGTLNGLFFSLFFFSSSFSFFSFLLFFFYSFIFLIFYTRDTSFRLPNLFIILLLLSSSFLSSNLVN